MYSQERQTHTHIVMSMEMMENEDDDHQHHEKQELSHHHHHLARQYSMVGNNRGLGQMRPHDSSTDHDDDHGGDHQGLRMMNKHSYFLRAKTPRPSGFRVGDDEDGEFKKPSSICTRLGMDHKERVPSLLPSPLQPSRSRADEYTSLSEEEDLANCLVMLANKSQPISSDEHKVEMKMKEVVEKGMFQCKACKKVFNSHQALGGHRASHKKVKGCFASKIEGLNDDENIIDEESIQEDQESLPPPELDAARPAPSATTRKRAKMHECSVCRRVFASGQALGGHKRCHWLTTSTDNAFIPNFHDFQYDHRSQQLCKKPILITKPHNDQQHNLDHHHHHNQNDHDHDHQLDLNLNVPPAPQHDQNRRDGDDKAGKGEASTRLCLQLGNDVVSVGEEGCGMKLRKLSDLRDVNLDGGWLQMGIPSTSEMR